MSLNAFFLCIALGIGAVDVMTASGGVANAETTRNAPWPDPHFRRDARRATDPPGFTPLVFTIPGIRLIGRVRRFGATVDARGRQSFSYLARDHELRVIRTGAKSAPSRILIPNATKIPAGFLR
jgi:hypothetical protein